MGFWHGRAREVWWPDGGIWNMSPRDRFVIRDRKIRIGIVGCGRISGNHFESINVHKEHLQLSAVCDTNAEALSAAESKYGVTGYQSLHEFLHSADVDLVVLCTPSGLHPQQAIEVAKAGRHVMTEKPMAT